MYTNTIVISAVNLVEGGSFSILLDCLEKLAVSDISKEYRIIALVNSISRMPKLKGIEYIEYPKAKKSYLYRCYYEYYAFHRLSKQLNPKLWLSLHDMSPRVVADVQAVYMHNPTPFYKPHFRDWRFVPLNAVWAYLYKYVYKANIKSNKYLIVQQNWLKREFSAMFKFPEEQIIVARPVLPDKDFCPPKDVAPNSRYTFFYPSFPRVFKNFDVICEAAVILQKRNINNVNIILTIDGSENKYSKYLLKKYSNLNNITFIGLLPRKKVEELYGSVDCLIFPSKLETWGLPLSEFKPYFKPMLVADLPYAHESSALASFVRFFNPDDSQELAKYMEDLAAGRTDICKRVPGVDEVQPHSSSWSGLFNILLKS